MENKKTRRRSVRDIEKESLEAHVDLCAERYANMADRMHRLEDGMTKRMDDLEDMLREISTGLQKKEESAMSTIFTIGLSTITALLGICGGLIWYIITHNPT